MTQQKYETDINFKPLTSGLGFHPFSDGLPYAPVSQTPKARATGTGAVAAGRPNFAFPVKTAASQGALPAAPSIPKTRPRVAVPIAASQSTAAPVQTQVQETKQLITQTFGYLYLAKRAFAFLIDTIINVVLCVSALSLALYNQRLQPELLLNPGVVVLSVVFFAAFSWAIITAQEIAFGTSIGKKVFGLAIRGSASAIFLRAFFFLPSAGFLGVGLAWSLFNPRRRCWHDSIVDLQPIEIAKL